MEKITCTVAEAMAALSLGHSSVYDLINANELRTIKVGKRRLVIVKSIRELVERLASQQGDAL